MSSIKKLNVISRNPDHYLRDTTLDLHKLPRNYDPDLHPLQVTREYKLALNATKQERMFAKPFVGDLTHNDTVSAMARHPTSLSTIFSGAYNGEIYLWNTSKRKLLWKTQAHNGPIWSLTTDCSGQHLYSVGHDNAIKRWPHQTIFEECDLSDVMKGPGAASHINEPADTWLCDSVVTRLSHHQHLQQFLSCGDRVLLWDSSKKVPIRNFDWTEPGSSAARYTVTDVAFNRVQTNLFATSDVDNCLVLSDTRSGVVKSLKMKHKLNSICWNPMEGFVLSAASEDYNSYTFDIRYMDHPVNRLQCTHTGHTNAVTFIDYSPTGREFATCSTDKSIRIFRVEENKSRDIYHTKRMHKVSCVMWSGDSKFIYSGSADHNIRIWKSNASEKLGIMSARQKHSYNYSQELREKFKHMPEVKRIARHRHVPRAILSAGKEHYRIRTSKARKEANVRLNSAPGIKVGETAVERPVFGLQDELEMTKEQEKEEVKKLKSFTKDVFRQKALEKQEDGRVREQIKLERQKANLRRQKKMKIKQNFLKKHGTPIKLRKKENEE